MSEHVSCSLDNENTELSKTFERDEEGITFSERLFSFLLDTPFNWEDVSDDDFNKAKEIEEAVIYFDTFAKEQHDEALKEYFARNHTSRRTVFRFYRNYCFNISELHENIFLVFIHSLALARSIINFNGFRDPKCIYYNFPLWWNYVFDIFVKEKFYCKKGWHALRTYLRTHFYPRYQGLTGLVTSPKTIRIKNLPCQYEDMDNFWNFPCSRMSFNYFWLEIIVEDDYCISD